MAVSVTNTTIAALNANQAVTWNAATSTGVNGTEVFTITPTKKGSKMAVFIKDASTAATAKYTYSIAAGDLFGKKVITGSAGSTAAAATMAALQIDTARVMTDDGTILATFTPATGKKLVGDHHLSVAVVELL